MFFVERCFETIDFMPLNSADQVGGTIITDWYSTTIMIMKDVNLIYLLLEKILKLKI